MLDLGVQGAEFVPHSTVYPEPRGLVLGPDGLYVVAEDALWRVDQDGKAEQVLMVEQPTVSDASYGQARTQLFFADLDGSGESSIVVGHRSNVAGFSVFRETGDDYERVFQSTIPDDPAGVAVADFTGDGLPDMVAVPEGRVLLWRNEGDYVFSEEATPAVEVNWAAHALFARDVDDDGDHDLVAVYSIRLSAPGEPHWGFIGIHRNDGEGNFSLEQVQLPTDSSFLVVAEQLEDVDGDGIADLVYASFDGLWLVPGDGDGFAAAVSIETADLTSVKHLTLGDTDGDDVSEIIYLGDGPGMTAPFTGAAVISVGPDGTTQRSLPANVGVVGFAAVAGGSAPQLYALSFAGRPCGTECDTDLFGACAECVTSDDCGEDAPFCVGGSCVGCRSDDDCDDEHWCRGGVCERAVSTSGGWMSVAASYRSGCGVKEEGSIECWGTDPAEPPAGTFTSIVMTLDEQSVACALDTDGEITCFAAENGRPELVPTTLPDGPFVQLEAAGFYTCGLRGDGSVSCFDEQGIYEASGDVTDLSSDYGYSCLLDGVGAVSCFDRDPSVTWSMLGSMQLPTSDIPQPVMSPAAPVTAAPSGVTLSRIAVGQSHACGIEASRDDTGPVVCWGSGRGVTQAPQAAFADLEAGTFLTCGIDEVGAVTCWGDIWQPRQTAFTSLSIRGSVPCAILDDGRFECQALELP